MKQLRKLLKSLSIIDLLLIVVIGIVSLSFFLFFYRKPEYFNIRVKVTDQDPLFQNTEPKNWYASQFQIGDAEYDALGRKNAEIIGVEEFNLTSNTRAVYVDMRVRGVFDTRSKQYSARGKTINFGTPMRFSLTKVTFGGFATEFPGSEAQKGLKIGYAIVKGMSRNIEPALAGAIPKDAQIYDSNKVLLAQIVDVTTRPAEKVTQTSAGELLLRQDPLYKDVLFTVKVRTKIKNEEMYIFDNLPLRIGDILPLNFTQASLFPIITDFRLE